MYVDLSMEKSSQTEVITRAFGHIQAAWAQRLNLEEDDIDAHAQRMSDLTAAFQSEHNTMVLYSAEQAISFVFREAVPRVVEDDIYDAEEEIIPHHDSGAMPRPLKELTTMISIRGMMKEGVCTSIGLERDAPESRKENFMYGCGRCSVQGSGKPQCWRHNQLWKSLSKKKVPNAWRNYAWDTDPEAEYAAISPREGCACMHLFLSRKPP